MSNLFKAIDDQYLARRVISLFREKLSTDQRVSDLLQDCDLETELPPPNVQNIEQSKPCVWQIQAVYQALCEALNECGFSEDSMKQAKSMLIKSFGLAWNDIEDAQLVA